MANWHESERKKRIAHAKRRYPDAFRRVRSVCVHAAFGFDLDDHAAKIVLAGKRSRS